jgi:hypothetical protein
MKLKNPMKQNCRFASAGVMLASFSLSIAFAVAPMGAAAQDASCNAYIQATVPKPDTPYRVKQTLKVDGKEMRSEAVYINGVIYSKTSEPSAGKWRATPIPDLKEAIEMAKKTTSGCSVTGVDLIDGKPMKVWASLATTPFESKPSKWKTWIGATDGRVYRQTSEGFDQQISYENVSAPPASEIAAPRKRK